MKLPNTFDAITGESAFSHRNGGCLNGNIGLPSLRLSGLLVGPLSPLLPWYSAGNNLAAITSSLATGWCFCSLFSQFGFAWLAHPQQISFWPADGGKNRNIQNRIASAQACFAAVVLPTYFVSFNPLSKPYVPDAAFSREVVEGFRFLGDMSDKATATVIATWWDYGYTATLFSQLPTLSMRRRGPKTHLLARALMSRDQSERAYLKYIGNDGTAGLAQNHEQRALAAFRRVQHMTDQISIWC